MPCHYLRKGNLLPPAPCSLPQNYPSERVEGAEPADVVAAEVLPVGVQRAVPVGAAGAVVPAALEPDAAVVYCYDYLAMYWEGGHGDRYFDPALGQSTCPHDPLRDHHLSQSLSVDGAARVVAGHSVAARIVSWEVAAVLTVDVAAQATVPTGAAARAVQPAG